MVRIRKITISKIRGGGVCPPRANNGIVPNWLTCGSGSDKADI